MSDTNHQAPTPDSLDRLTEALRDSDISPGPSEDLIASTLSAIDQRLAGLASERAARNRRHRMLKSIAYAGLSAAAALVALSFIWVREGTAALERAFDKVEKATAVRLRVRASYGGQGEQANTVTTRGTKLRVENVGGAGIVWVSDRDEQAALITLPAKKLYQTVDMSRGAVVPSEFFAMDVREQLLALRKQKAEAVGAERVTGEWADKYAVKGGKAFHLEGDWVVWVGRKSGLPVRVTLETSTRGQAMTRVYDSFDWDPKTDDSTFALDPPAGYREATVFGIVPPMPPRKKK